MAAKNAPAVAEGFQLVSAYDGMDDELKEQMMDEMDDLDDDGGIGARKIKMPGSGGKAYEIEGDDPDDSDVAKDFEAVILFTHRMNGRWESSFDGKANPPVCSSVDAKKGVIFDTGEVCDCETCMYNQYGSAAEGGAGKACKNMRRIYMMLSGRPWLYMLSVPPTSLKGVNGQLKRIMAASGLPLSRLVVRFSLVQGTTGDRTVSKVNVERVGILSPELHNQTKAARESIKAQFRNVGVGDDDYTAAAAREPEPPAPPVDADGFMNVPDGMDENLPFN